MALEHEHPVEAAALFPAGGGLVGVTVAGLNILRVHRVHGTRAEWLVCLIIRKYRY